MKNVHPQHAPSDGRAPILSTGIHRDHLPALDGLRGVAVLLVLYGHLPILGAVDRLARSALAPHYLGVEIFFVLSGFLITRILRYDLAHGGTIPQFLARRALRIFPIYYLTLAILAVAWPGDLGLWKYLVYVQNIVFAFRGQEGPPLNHTWSLAVEEHFYLVWPFVVLMFWRGRWLGQVATGLAMAGWAAMFLHAYLGGAHAAGAINYLTPYRVPTLLIGSMLAVNETHLRKRAPRIVAIGGIALVVGVGIGLHTRLASEGGPIAQRLAERNMSLGLVAIAAFCAGWATAVGWARLGRLVLEAGILRFVGRISYGLYLYHFPIYGALGIGRGDDPSQTLGERALRGGAAVLLTFATATLSFYALEKPILRFKRQFSVPSPPPSR